jgi:calpain-7
MTILVASSVDAVVTGKKVTGSFTSKTAGGNRTYPTFMINPQYRLWLHPSNLKSEKAKVTLTLQAGKDLPVNVAMVWSQGQRISE